MNTTETPPPTSPPAFDSSTGAPAREWRWEWQEIFLRGLRAMDNVTSAAKLAQIDRTRAYQVRDEDPEFAAAWADAVEQATDGLEVFAHRMATTGLEFTVTRRTVKRQLLPDANGAMRMVVVEETEVEETGRTISPAVTMFLLRSHRPEKYAPLQRVEHGGRNGAPGVLVQHEIYRQPNPQRALELARIALELAPGPDEHPVIEGTVANGDGS